MENAFGDPQTVVLLGGTSDIGQAIVRRAIGPGTTTVVLASRRPDGADAFAAELAARGIRVESVAFDATQADRHGSFVAELASTIGDLDLVILAFGVLGHGAGIDVEPAQAAADVTVNYVGAVSAGLAVAQQQRRQGHGRLVVLSSVAGERVRKANFVYGSSKAGLDGFAQGLSDSLAGSGASVLIVRPGFVTSRMTAGLKPAPFATTPEAVAEVTVRGLRRGSRVVWAPGILRWVFMVFRHLPHAIWRRLPF
jgi:decaprenylphospho-beta-D-erythro-pentofuranosid-2-ulose 2-reductase